MSDGSRLPTSWSQNFGPAWNYSHNQVQEANLNLTHRFSNGWKSSATVLYRVFGYESNDAYPLGASGSDPYVQDYSAEKQKGVYSSVGLDTNVTGPAHLFGREHALTVGASFNRTGERFYFGGQDLGNWNVLEAAGIPQPALSYASLSKSIYQQGGVYGQARFKLSDPLALTLGARETWYQQTSGSDTADWSVSSRMNAKFVPYAGIVYDVVPSVSAYASYATVFAPQTGLTTSGEGLAPASGRQVEIGVKTKLLGDQLHGSIAAFRIDNGHYAISDPAAPNFYVDAGKVRSQGLEAEVSGEPVPGWNVYAGYTLLMTKYLSGGDSTGQTFDMEEPRHLLKVWTNYRFTAAPLQGWTVGGGMQAQSPTTRFTPSYEQGGFAVYNAQASYRFNRHVSASLTLNNLFDRHYYSRTPDLFFAQFGDRRNAVLAIRTDFQ